MKISRTEIESCAEGAGISRVGAWLRISREKNGITLDEVANVTRIGKNYLEAIEQGALCKLPSQAYTRGFIRLYASNLGLSPEEALAMLEESQTGPAEANPELQPHPQTASPPLNRYRRRLALTTTLAIALAAGYFLFKPTEKNRVPIQNSRIETGHSVQTVTIPSTQTQQNPPASDPSTTPVPEQQINRKPEGIVLRLKAVSDGKIHITIDGSVYQEYDLVTGDLIEWKADNTFILDLDNAASVEGELNGVKLNSFGEQGSSAHLTLKADSINKVNRK